MHRRHLLDQIQQYIETHPTESECARQLVDFAVIGLI